MEAKQRNQRCLNTFAQHFSWPMEKKKRDTFKGWWTFGFIKKKKKKTSVELNSQELFHISAKALSKYISHVTSKRKHVSVSFCKADRSCLSHFNKIKGHQKWWEKNKPLWKWANSNAFTYKMVIYKIIFSKKCIFIIGNVGDSTHFNSLGKRIHRMKHVYHLNIIFILKRD